jgi:hypothetical protein
MGHKGSVYKAKVHRDRKGMNPNANQSVNQSQLIHTVCEYYVLVSAGWKCTGHTDGRNCLVSAAVEVDGTKECRAW